MVPRSSSYVKEVTDKRLDQVDISAIIEVGDPVIFRGAYKDKPLVSAGLISDSAAMEHLRKFDAKRKLTGFIAAPEHKGRFFYNDDATALDFDRVHIDLDPFLDALTIANESTSPTAYYAGSTDLKTYFPDMLETDDLALGHAVFRDIAPLTSIWIGNRSVAATHFDMSNNIAACMVGHRRFTLFPPDQIANLYPGPLSPTPAGQIVSMIDLRNPNTDKYPNISKALEVAQVAELGPGDVLIYPAMWWHQVEALDDFNVLINYWWNDTPRFLENPMNTLMHGLLSLRERPDYERRAWRSLFDYYLFGDPDLPRAHLDPTAHGMLAGLDEPAARRLRMTLLNKLNR